MTEYQAGLLIHRFSAFDRMQAVRRKNFEYLRKLMRRCCVPGAFGFGCRCPRSRNVYVRDAL